MKNVKYFNKTFYFFELKTFAKKYKTIVKNIKSENEINEKKEEQNLNNDENLFVKPKFIANTNDPNGLNILSSFDDVKIKRYYKELQSSIINLEESEPRRINYMLTAHLIPAVYFIDSFSNLMWVYQTFWIGSSIGLVYSSYEFYSDRKEKRILDNHILIGYLLCILVISLSLAGKLLNDKEQKKYVKIANCFNFFSIYFLFSNKYREFYIPKWIKYSLRKILPLCFCMGLYSIYKEEENLNINSIKSEEESRQKINAIHYRYLKDLTSIIPY